MIAEVPTCGEDIVEAVFELITEGLLGTFILIDARLAFEEVVGKAQAVARVQGTVGRQSAVVAAVRVVLQVRLQGQ
ncbi:hypothetical protein D3C78_1907630 [compost metagenome]